MLNLLHTQWDNHVTHAPYHTLTNSDFIRQTAPIKVILSAKQRRELSRRILDTLHGLCKTGCARSMIKI